MKVVFLLISLFLYAFEVLENLLCDQMTDRFTPLIMRVLHCVNLLVLFCHNFFIYIKVSAHAWFILVIVNLSLVVLATCFVGSWIKLHLPEWTKGT